MNRSYLQLEMLGYLDRLIEDRSPLVQMESLDNINSWLKVNFMGLKITPHWVELLLQVPLPEMDVRLAHAWNPNDSSSYMKIKLGDPFTCIRSSASKSSEAIRGKVGFRTGFHVWEICWPWNNWGGNPTVGVATIEAPLRRRGNWSAVGNTKHSWGWNLKNLSLYHGGKRVGVKYPKGEEDFMASWKFYMFLNMNEGTLGFGSALGEFHGIAFKGLKGKTLFPVVSSNHWGSEIRMIYKGGIETQPPSLMSIGLHKVREIIGRENLAKVVPQLELPETLKQGLNYHDHFIFNYPTPSMQNDDINIEN